MKIKLEDIVRATGAKVVTAGNVSEIGNVSIDTRTIKPSDLFVAIKGPHFDGHGFIDEAVKKGACGAVVSDDRNGKKGGLVLKVEDTVRALGDIAALWRTKNDFTCIAVTGSNGKSTTKEMIAAGLSDMRNVIKTEGNFNNLIGLPLQLMRVEASNEIAVLEMGMNAPGEIRRLTEIARPDVGLITNVNPAHLERLHTVENVARAKGELFEAMPKDKTAVINAEDPWVAKLGEAYPGRKIKFGMQNGCDVQFGRMVSEGLDRTDMTFYVKGREYAVSLPLPGVHNVMNALAAIAAGYAVGVSPLMMIPNLESFTAMKMRFERIQLLNGTQLINDSYNANPSSMYAALRTIGSAKRAGRFIAVLGDMLELGEASKEKHEELGRNAVKLGVNRLYAIGEFADETIKGAIKEGMKKGEALRMTAHDEIKKELRRDIKTGDIVLVKGSRGMRMEQIAEFLKDEIGV